MNYHVIAYRWGYTNEQFCLFSSESLDDCIDVACKYPDWRGGKYGCAVYESAKRGESVTGDGGGDPVFYSPSLHGESRPQYNHRCDVFNSVVSEITHHEEYENTPWLESIVKDAEAMADRRNKLENKKP